MRIFGTIIGGKFCCMPEQARIEEHYLKAYKDGTLAYRETGKFTQNKTHQQVKAYWGLAMTTIEQAFADNGWDTSYLLRLDHETGIACDKDLIYEYLCNVCPVYEQGKRITLSKMSIEQAIKFFDDCRAFASSQWGIYVPEPDPRYKEKIK